MNNLPLISVVLPVFNGDRYLLDAIQSILTQSYSNLELIVVDDCSSDNTQALLTSLSDPRIKIFRNNENLGIAKTLNFGIQRSSGEFIARMDADDISLPYRLETQLTFLKENNSCDLLASSCIIFDDYGLGSHINTKLSHANICKHSWLGFHLPHPSWMMRASWIKLHAYNVLASGVEDQLLLYDTYDHSNFVSLRQPLLLYRVDQRAPYKKIFFRRILLAKLFVQSAYKRKYFHHIPLIISALFGRLIYDAIKKIKIPYL